MHDPEPATSESKWVYAVLLLPIACCGGPLLVAFGGAGVAWAALHGAWLGGGAAVLAGTLAFMGWRAKRTTPCADCGARVERRTRGGV